MSDSPSKAHTPVRTKPRVPRGLIAALALLALLLAFEVTVRLIQPDRMTYTATIAEGSAADPTYRHAHVTTTDPRVVAQWYAAVNADPIPFDQTNAFTFDFVHCNGMAYSGQSYRFEFTWHGLPLETVTSSDWTNCGVVLWVTSGGIPDPQAYRVPEALLGVAN